MTDFKKNREVTWLTEIGPVMVELDFAIKNLKTWMSPQKVKTNSFNYPAKSYIASEPMGRILIIGC